MVFAVPLSAYSQAGNPHLLIQCLQCLGIPAAHLLQRLAQGSFQGHRSILPGRKFFRPGGEQFAYKGCGYAPPGLCRRPAAQNKKGIRIGIFYTCIWCTLSAVASYTIGSWLVYLVTGSTNEVVILNATSYLKFDTLFYYVTAVICVLRNAMQGLGDHITPLISSSLEMAGKIVIAATLVPMLGYTGVIVAEPLVWFIMVIPLVVQIFRMPVLREENRMNQGK